MQQREILDAALNYAGRGWAVFPLNGKRPFPDTQGFRDATTETKQIRRWWKHWPKANVGIACDSQRGPIVIDIDGPSGLELLAELSLPPTREATSGRPHRHHLYFNPLLDGTAIPRMIKLRHNGVKHEFDVLGDGGYVVAPPSIHPETKQPYRWLTRRSLAPLPDSILQLVRQNKSTVSADPLPAVIGEGERDTLLTSLAGSMRRRGASPESIVAALREMNATHVSPPLDDRQLVKIAKSIGSKKPVVVQENLSDLGNARRFIKEHGRDVRSIMSPPHPWFIWDGMRWAPDALGEVQRMAKGTVRGLYEEAQRIEDGDLRGALLKHALKSESASRLFAIPTIAATEREVALPADAFDSYPWLFNVENGTINLRTGVLMRHTRAHLITKLAPVEYHADAKCPRWDQFLLEIMEDDEELVQYLQRAIGYAMVGDTREQCLFFCYGRGANGKSTFFEAIRELFGGYAQQADFTTLLTRRSDGPRDDLARMRGARLVTAVEADYDRGFDSTVVKQLTGGDTIVARGLYEKLSEFKPQHTMFLAANHRPVVKEHTEAFWRRIRLVPFTRTFTPGQRDKSLDQQLREELPGILNWAIAGALAWQRHGLVEPKTVRRAIKDYRNENDTLAEFFEARCALEDDTAWTSTLELYKVFSDWWIDTRGARAHPISMGWFTRMLSERSDVTAKKDGIHRGWRGIAIRHEVGA